MVGRSEERYFSAVRRIAKWSPPPLFAKVIGSSMTSRTGEWLEGKGSSKTAVLSASWTSFVAAISALAVLTAVSSLLLGPGILTLLLLPAILLPLILATMIANAPREMIEREERTIFAESPAVVGCMAMNMHLYPSVERAVVFATRHSEGALVDKLKRSLWSVTTRSRSTVLDSLLDLTESLSELNDSLKQAMHLIISSTHERSREGMSRLLDKANSIVLDGVKNGVERYVSSLSVPTMVLFALGVLLPVMLLSLSPLASMSSILDTSNLSADQMEIGIQSYLLPFLLLVIFPLSSFLYARSVLSRNPVSAPRPDNVNTSRRVAAAGIVSVIAGATASAADFGDMKPYLILLGIVLPLSLAMTFDFREGHLRRKTVSENDRDFASALYQIGNRMLAGGSLETALRQAAEARRGSSFHDFAANILHRSRMRHTALEDLLTSDQSEDRISPLVSGAFRTVAESAKRDTVGAGQIALNLAQYLSDLRSCEERIREKQKGVVDMMTSTTTFFAPIVLGVTSSLVGIIGQYGQGSPHLASENILVSGGYLAELTFVVSYFTVFLLGERSWKEVLYQFGRRAPVAILVFTSVSLLCQTGLTRLL